MSSTNRGAKRKPSDFYETPPPLARAFARYFARAWVARLREQCRRVEVTRIDDEAPSFVAGQGWNPTLDRPLEGVRILEPAVGRGSIAVELQALGARVNGSDLVSYRAEARAPGFRWGVDFLRASPADYAEGRPGDPFDAVITNPPFSGFEAFATHAHAFAPLVIFLGRVNILGASERVPFWRMFPPASLTTITPRPPFVSACRRPRRLGACSATYPLEYRGRCRAVRPDSDVVCGYPVGPATDSCEYGWIGWGASPFPAFDWLDWTAERDSWRAAA